MGAVLSVKKLFLALGAALLAVLAVPFGYFYVWPFLQPDGFLGPCGFEVMQESVSPDGTLKAAAVEVNCGATTDYASWAVLTRADRAFDFKKDRIAAIPGREMRVGWEGRKLVVFWYAERPPTVREGRPAAQVEYRPL